MPIDQICMSLMAVLMLVAAVMGTNVMAGPFETGMSVDRATVVQTPKQSSMIEGEIFKVDVKELEVIVMVKDVKTSFKVAPSVQISKDRKEVKLGALAQGDYVVLTLASAGSKIVTRIEAVSSR